LNKDLRLSAGCAKLKMASRKNYTDEAEKLAKAIDIAIEAFLLYSPPLFTSDHIKMMISHLKSEKEAALNPEAKYRSLVSLKYIIDSVFTFFQESSGETVDYFWEKISENKLGYERKNKFLTILKRNKIKGRIEYDYVIDILIVARQQNQISADDAARLQQLITDYEKKIR
jgi:hypothetical protein